MVAWTKTGLEKREVEEFKMYCENRTALTSSRWVVQHMDWEKSDGLLGSGWGEERGEIQGGFLSFRLEKWVPFIEMRSTVCSKRKFGR